MSRVLDAQKLELELARVLAEPAHLRPALTLVLIQIEGLPGGRSSAAAGERDLLGSLASAVGDRLRRVDTVGLLDDSAFAVLLVGAAPAAAKAVARELEGLLQPLLEDAADRTDACVVRGLSAATAGIDGESLIALARADLQRRAQRRSELTPL
jgi:hypothetical protein